MTLMTFMLLAGIFTVTKEGEAAAGKQVAAIELDYGELSAACETADNLLTFFAPKVKAAAHLGLIVCAALSELY